MDEQWTQLEETLLQEGEPILTYKMKLPSFTGTKKGEKRLQRYYTRMEEVWKRYFTEELYQACCDDLTEKREKSRIFTPWNLSLIGEVEEFGDHLLSVGLTAQVKKGKSVTQCHFYSELWDCEKGYPKILSQQEPVSCYKQDELIEKIKEVLKSQKELRLFEDYQDKLQGYFSKRQFYFTKEGVFVYFDQGSIAAPEEGILKFMLFSENYSCTH